MADTKQIKVTFDFAVPVDADLERFAEAVFDILCDQDDDVPYVSCDGWDFPRG